MNAGDLAEIKARHAEPGHACPHCEEYCCADGGFHKCGEPCAENRLVAEVERLQEGLRAVLERHVCGPEFPETHPWARCVVCFTTEKRWPCTTVLEARAALGEQPAGPTLEGRADDAG